MAITSDVEGTTVLAFRWEQGAVVSSFDYVTEWWAGSIAVPVSVELVPEAPSAEVCFTLSRGDGVLYTTSSDTQCQTFDPSDAEHTFRWEGLTAGTYSLEETIDLPYVPISTNPIVDLVVDEAHQDVILPTFENQLPMGELWIEKRDEVGALWAGPDVVYEIYDCGEDVECIDPIGPAEWVTVSPDQNPAMITLKAGRYLVWEVVPGSNVAQPDDQRVVEIQTGQRILLAYANHPAQAGCSPGYWKTHTQSWYSRAWLDPQDSFNQTFGVSFPGRDMTLLEAVDMGGGAEEKLARHAVAALINARSNIGYSFSRYEVIEMVRAGLAADGTLGEPEATDLAVANNTGCPLD